MLALYGVPMAALLGLLTGLLAFLPNIGAPVSGALMILVGFSGGTDMGIYCIIVYLVIHLIDGNIIVPLVAKKTVDLAPALVLGAQLIMGVLVRHTRSGAGRSDGGDDQDLAGARSRASRTPGPGLNRRVADAPSVTDSALAFRTQLPGGGALLGLDLGTQTIGTAFCDAGWRFASPGKTLARGKFTADMQLLAALVAERAIKGWSSACRATWTAAKAHAPNRAAPMPATLQPLGLPILLWDERWSTASAERQLIAQDISRSKRAGRIDAAAAAVILQGAIDALTGGVVESAARSPIPGTAVFPEL